MNPTPYARVAVNIPQLSDLYDYSIPGEWGEQISTGSLVTVPFGRQVTQGIVVEMIAEPSVSTPKPLSSLVEKDPVVTKTQIELAQWMAEKYLSGLADCLELMLPPGLAQQADILIRLLPGDIPAQLTSTQKRIVALLQKRGALRGKQLDRSLPRTDWRKSLPGLENLGLIIREQILKAPTAKAKVGRTVHFVSMPDTEELLGQLGRTGSQAFERRMKVLEFLKDEPESILANFIYAETGANAADLSRLADLGLIQFSQAEIWRDPLEKIKPSQSISLHLTAEQQLVVKDRKSTRLNSSH